MKTVADCALCLLKLAHTSAKAANADEPRKLAAVQAALEILAADDFSRIPPAIAGDVIERINAALEVDDPFRELKHDHDQKAMAIVDQWAPGFMAKAADDDDRLARAVRAALVGNSLDLATMPETADPENFKQWLEAPWAINHWEEFKAAQGSAQKILYVCDNAGEVAFDRILVQELLDRGKKVTASVKGGPALNDATMEDALLVGMDKLAGPDHKLELITTGQAAMGVDPARASDEWMAAFAAADVVIAKGQANLECLHDYGREVFFLTLSKCSHVSRHYGIKKGSAMLYKGGMEGGEKSGRPG